jgi:uncharacterized protein (TIGR00369 family)
MNAAEAIQKRIRGLFPDLMGMEFVEAGPDLVSAKLKVRADLCTGGSILHGGAIMAFADTIGAVATILNIPESSGTATLESKTNFFRPAPAGTEVTGTCTALHRGKRTMTWQTTITSAEGKLIAVVTQTQMVL